jgi:hypothetical protein
MAVKNIGMGDRGCSYFAVMFNRERRKTVYTRGTGPNLNFRMESRAIG